MSQPGYIYVLYNPSANGFVKIGKTQRYPDDRAKELSSATGVPTPFVVVYQCNFQDCDKAELFIHTRLDRYRVSNNREFFQLPIHLAIDTVLEAKNILEKTKNIFDELEDTSNENSNEEFLDSLTLDDSRDPSIEMLEAANSYYHGYEDDTIQDYDEAFNLYQKAARLGSAEAFLQMGCMCRDGEGRSVDNKRALEFFKEGIKYGNDECWAEMAIIFHSEGHKNNTEKCWNKYFSSENFNNFSYRKSFSICRYVYTSILENNSLIYREQIIQARSKVLESFNNLIEDAKNGINVSNLDLAKKCFIAVKEL